MEEAGHKESDLTRGYNPVVYCVFFFVFFFKGSSRFTWAYLIAQLVKNLPAMQETPF